MTLITEVIKTPKRVRGNIPLGAAFVATMSIITKMAPAMVMTIQTTLMASIRVRKAP